MVEGKGQPEGSGYRAEGEGKWQWAVGGVCPLPACPLPPTPISLPSTLHPLSFARCLLHYYLPYYLPSTPLPFILHPLPTTHYPVPFTHCQVPCTLYPQPFIYPLPTTNLLISFTLCSCIPSHLMCLYPNLPHAYRTRSVNVSSLCC